MSFTEYDISLLDIVDSRNECKVSPCFIIEERKIPGGRIGGFH